MWLSISILEEEMVLYFDACVEEDPGDGSLIRAALGMRLRAEVIHPPTR